jgi:hypothetical protein
MEPGIENRSGEHQKQSLAPVCVEVPVVPSLNIQCKFWLNDGGWNAAIERLNLMVHAPDFISAKNSIETAVGEHIEKLLGVSARKTDEYPAQQ